MATPNPDDEETDRRVQPYRSPGTRYEPPGIGHRLLAGLAITLDEEGLDPAYQAALHDVETTILAREVAEQAITEEPTTAETVETVEFMNREPMYTGTVHRQPILRGAARRRMLEFARDEYMAYQAQAKAQQPPPPEREEPAPVGQLNPTYLDYKHLRLTDPQIMGRIVRPPRELELVEEQIAGRMVRRYSHEQLIDDHVQALEATGREIAVRPPELSPQVREPPRGPERQVLAVGDPHFRDPSEPIRTRVIRRDDLVREYMQGAPSPSDIVPVGKIYTVNPERILPYPGLNPVALARERQRLGQEFQQLRAPLIQGRQGPEGPQGAREPEPRTSFGDAMAQLFRQQPKITMMTGTPMIDDPTELRQVMNLIRPPGEQQEIVHPPIEHPRVDTRPMQPDAEGWIDFTNVEELERARQIIFQDHNIMTTQGLQDAIQEVKDEVVGGGTRLIIPAVRGARANPPDMYIDPETGDEHRLLNGTWRNITQETAAILAQEAVTVHAKQRTRHPIPVEEFPRTIQVQADPTVVHDYMQDAINSPAALTHRMRLPIITDDTDELIPPDREEIGEQTEQLTEIAPTGQILPTPLKEMARTTPDIITNPTPDMFQSGGTRDRQFVTLPRHPRGWTDPPARAADVVPPVPQVPAPIVPQVPAPTVAPVPIPRILPTARAPAPLIPAAATRPRQAVPGMPAMPMIPPIPAVKIPQKPATKQPEVVLLPLPERNPYLNLHRRILDQIAQERDVTLTGSAAERMEQLFDFDKIMPDWIQSILSKDINNFQLLTGPKLYVFGSMHGVSFTGVDRLQNRDLINYIRGFILVSNPQHPGRHCLAGLVVGLSRSVLELLAPRVNINPIHLQFIDTDGLRTALINGNLAHLRMEYIETIAARYRLLMDHNHRRLLGELYDVHNDEDWIGIARADPHPMEPIILNLDAYDKRKLALQFGMTIPLAFEMNVDEYVRNNIVRYAPVLTRQQVEIMPLEVLRFMDPERLETYLSQLMDTEIFTHVGIYVDYRSRQELVGSIIRAIHEPQFLYPAIRVPERANNRMTIGLTDITDTTVFMVGYGTAMKYQVYELADLIGAFYLDREMAAIQFRRPENDKLLFATRDIEGLRQLLDCFPETPDLVTLKQRIDEGLITAREHIEHDNTARIEIAKFTMEEQTQIREFLRKVFYIGMYMRRWQGPGHPFPLKQNDTKNRPDPDDKVKEEIKPATAILEQMRAVVRRFCMNLRLCEYNDNGGISHGFAIFEGEWHEVGSGKQCIRMASSKFIGTAYHYLRALFRETIPGVDTKAIDRIT